MLSSNAQTIHWAVKAKAVKAARTAAKKEAERVLEGAPPPRWEKAKLVVTFFLLPKHRGQDPTNAIYSLKAYIDGLEDAGIVKNDRGLFPERPRFVKTDRMPRVELEITNED